MWQAGQHGRITSCRTVGSSSSETRAFPAGAGGASQFRSAGSGLLEITTILTFFLFGFGDVAFQALADPAIFEEQVEALHFEQ